MSSFTDSTETCAFHEYSNDAEQRAHFEHLCRALHPCPPELLNVSTLDSRVLLQMAPCTVFAEHSRVSVCGVTILPALSYEALLFVLNDCALLAEKQDGTLRPHAFISFLSEVSVETDMKERLAVLTIKGPRHRYVCHFEDGAVCERVAQCMSSRMGYDPRSATKSDRVHGRRRTSHGLTGKWSCWELVEIICSDVILLWTHDGGSHRTYRTALKVLAIFIVCSIVGQLLFHPAAPPSEPVQQLIPWRYIHSAEWQETPNASLWNMVRGSCDAVAIRPQSDGLQSLAQIQSNYRTDWSTWDYKQLQADYEAQISCPLVAYNPQRVVRDLTEARRVRNVRNGIPNHQFARISNQSNEHPGGWLHVQCPQAYKYLFRSDITEPYAVETTVQEVLQVPSGATHVWLDCQGLTNALPIPTFNRTAMNESRIRRECMKLENERPLFQNVFILLFDALSSVHFDAEMRVLNRMLQDLNNDGYGDDETERERRRLTDGASRSKYRNFKFRRLLVNGVNSRPNKVAMFAGIDGGWPGKYSAHQVKWLMDYYREKGFISMAAIGECNRCAGGHTAPHCFGEGALPHEYHLHKEWSGFADLFPHAMLCDTDDARLEANGFKENCLASSTEQCNWLWRTRCCVGHAPIWAHSAQYMVDMANLYKEYPKFFFGQVLDPHMPHWYNKAMDEQMPFYVRQLMQHPDSLIMLVADHGFHYLHRMRESEGFVHHKNPFMNWLIPINILEAHPEIESTLLANVGKVMGHYDTFATLRHLLTYPAMMPSTTTHQGASFLREGFASEMVKKCADAHCPCDYQRTTLGDERSLRLKTAVAMYAHARLAEDNMTHCCVAYDANRDTLFDVIERHGQYFYFNLKHAATGTELYGHAEWRSDGNFTVQTMEPINDYVRSQMAQRLQTKCGITPQTARNEFHYRRALTRWRECMFKM